MPLWQEEISEWQTHTEGWFGEFQQDYVCHVHLLSSNAALLIVIGRTLAFLKLPKKEKSSVDLEPLLNEQVST